MAEVKVTLRVLRGEEIAIGPGKADLLEAVERTGSIAAAGRALGISYRRTRDMIDTLNRCWGSAVVETAKGGRAGGGARLTPRGREVLGAYRAASRDLERTADRHRAALLALTGPSSGGE